MDLQETITQTSRETVAAATEVSWVNILIIIAGAVLIRVLSKHFIGTLVDGAIRSHRYSSKKERTQRRDTLVAIFMTVITVLIVATAVILIMVEFGVNFTALIASAGAIGVVAGIAGQSLLKDMLKGVSIILYNQMRIGDIVTVAEFSGVVEALSLRFTRLRDLDGDVHIVPNGEITVVTNHSLGYANVNLDVSVSYDSDIAKVEKIINQVGESMDGEPEWDEIINKPISFLRVDSFGESGVNIKALGEVIPGEQWAVAGEFRRRLKEAFDKEGVKIPYPQRVIHTISDKSDQAGAK